MGIYISILIFSFRSRAFAHTFGAFGFVLPAEPCKNTGVCCTGATGRSKWLLEPARVPLERSEWLLEPARVPLERSKWPLERARVPLERSKWLLEPARVPLERSKWLLEPARVPLERSKWPARGHSVKPSKTLFKELSL